MSIDISKQVWDSSRHVGTARVAMLALADMANSDGYCWPSIRRLAQMCNCSERQMQRVIMQLEESGEVFAERSSGRGNTSRYLVTVQPDSAHLIGCLVLHFNCSPADAVRMAESHIARWEKWAGSGASSVCEDAEKGDIQGEKVTSRARKGDIAMSPDPLIEPLFDPETNKSGFAVAANTVQATQQPPKPPKPPEPSEPPMGERSGFHDLLGQSRNSWFGMRSTQRDALQRQQLARQAGLGDGLSGEVVDKLIELHGLRAVVDAGDDRSLRRMQDMAILLGSAPLFVRTVEQIVALFDDWKAANRNKIAPYGNVFAEYASRLHAEGRLQDGRVIGKPAAGGSSSGKGRGRAGGARRQPASDGIDWNAASRATGEYILANVPDVPIGDIDF